VIRPERSAREPVGVLVVTVWSDAGGLRRVVSLTDPELRAAEPGLELQRSYAASDTAVLGLVRNWLDAVGERSHRPRPHAVATDASAGSADPGSAVPGG